MSFLILARHGNCNYDTEKLTEGGRTQIHLLGKTLKEKIGEEDLYLFSAQSPITVQSSEILKEYLTSSNFEIDCHLSDNYILKGRSHEFNKYIQEKLSSDKPVLLMTHKGFIDAFIGFYILSNISVDKGKAIFFKNPNSWEIIPKI